MPIVSIITNPENLFSDEHGIYVSGKIWAQIRSCRLYIPQYSPFKNTWQGTASCIVILLSLTNT